MGRGRMDDLHICVAFDQNFIIPANTMINSVLRNTTEVVHFHLLVPSRQFDVGVVFLDQPNPFNHGIFSIYPVEENSIEFSMAMDGILHFSNAALYRLFMTQYLPKWIDRILYLDGDLIVNLDISEVFKENSNSVFSARIENAEIGYFNSGVFLTSLNYWRINEIGKSCADYLTQNPESQYKDQDALNHVFSNINKPMEKRFNYPIQDYGIFQNRNLKNAVFHFTGTIKPWKDHAPSVFPVNLWRRIYADTYGRPVALQKVRYRRIKKIILTLKCIR